MDPQGGEPLPDVETNYFRSSDYPEDDKSTPHTGDGANPGFTLFLERIIEKSVQIWLFYVSSATQFLEHFGKYGEITDSMIMKDRKTRQPRGFGFVTYVEPFVVDKVIEDTHVINGNQVDIKRTIPKEASGSKDFKTRKIFVGVIPSTVSEGDTNEFKEYFTQYEEVREHEIMRDHATNRSRGFGFITFETKQVVDDLLEKGNKINFAGDQV
ncbi:heterogeneous nuclear ribonucleoprotein 1-like [Hibiscus syriacus]|uniref:heterogeneous nuclear ribonucleoprotein 1-like n=1 Tax=Hibiscus syriacus TaxID=106335 RepID=UPI00192322D6|nr:heterogeneous nuclear ribonucleoprotein 1-like [Hibiscus syriacus]